MEQRLRTRLASLGILLVVLATGFVLGVTWERHGPTLAAETSDERVEGDERGDRRHRDDDDRDDDKRDRRLIVERVGLRPAQESEVDSIVEIHREKMRALQKEFRSEYNPRYWSLIQDTRDAIKSVLDEEQRERYDSLLAEHDRRRDEDRDDHGKDTGRDDDGSRDGPDGRDG